jgi:hypothetical protein
VLGAVVVDEGDSGVQVGDEDDPAVVGEGPSEDVAPARGGQAATDLGLDRVGEGDVGGDQQGRRIRAVLRLRDEVGGDGPCVGAAVREDEALRGSRGKVDADLPGDLDLGGRDPGGSRPDDQVDGGQALTGQPVRERGDRLDAARHEERVDVQQARGAEQHRVHPSVGVRG